MLSASRCDRLTGCVATAGGIGSRVGDDSGVAGRRGRSGDCHSLPSEYQFRGQRGYALPPASPYRYLWLERPGGDDDAGHAPSHGQLQHEADQYRYQCRGDNGRRSLHQPHQSRPALGHVLVPDFVARGRRPIRRALVSECELHRVDFRLEPQERPHRGARARRGRRSGRRGRLHRLPALQRGVRRVDAAVTGFRRSAPSTRRSSRRRPTLPGRWRARTSISSHGLPTSTARRRANTCAACATRRRSRSPANGKIDSDKLPPCPDGRPRDVVAKYNEFIRTSNDHQFPVIVASGSRQRQRCREQLQRWCPPPPRAPPWNPRFRGTRRSHETRAPLIAGVVPAARADAR